jgi:Protein of unknown function (DUF2500)
VDDGFGGFEKIFIAFIALFFIVVLGAILWAILRGLGQWQRNNSLPVTTVPATVLAKRHELRGGSGDTRASTSHFVTFEVEGGERVELPVSGPDFGVMIERDRGQLTYQGTRFKAFARTPQDR